MISNKEATPKRPFARFLSILTVGFALFLSLPTHSSERVFDPVSLASCGLLGQEQLGAVIEQGRLNGNYLNWLKTEYPGYLAPPEPFWIAGMQVKHFNPTQFGQMRGPTLIISSPVSTVRDRFARHGLVYADCKNAKGHQTCSTTVSSGEFQILMSHPYYPTKGSILICSDGFRP